MPCPNGLWFDTSANVCNYPDVAVNSRCQGRLGYMYVLEGKTFGYVLKVCFLILSSNHTNTNNN